MQLKISFPFIGPIKHFIVISFLYISIHAVPTIALFDLSIDSECTAIAGQINECIFSHLNNIEHYEVFNSQSIIEKISNTIESSNRSPVRSKYGDLSSFLKSSYKFKIDFVITEFIERLDTKYKISFGIIDLHEKKKIRFAEYEIIDSGEFCYMASKIVNTLVFNLPAHDERKDTIYLYIDNVNKYLDYASSSFKGKYIKVALKCIQIDENYANKELSDKYIHEFIDNAKNKINVINKINTPMVRELQPDNMYLIKGRIDLDYSFDGVIIFADFLE
ncbi:hypothetical protein ACFL6D_05110 [Spirochaetota bacterium]